MESQSLIDLVKSHCDEIREPYVLTEDVIWPSSPNLDPAVPPVTDLGGYYVIRKYLGPILTRTPSTARKEYVIRELHEGWRAFARIKGRHHEPVREYGRMSIGCSVHLLWTSKADMSGNAIDFVTFKDKANKEIKPGLVTVADSIVRVSRWFQTRRGEYTFPQKWVDEYIRWMYGDIEDLIRTKGISCQWKDEPIRTREPARCPNCRRQVDYKGRLHDFCRVCSPKNNQ